MKEKGEEVETQGTKELEDGLVRKKERDQMRSVGQNLDQPKVVRQ